MTDEEVSDRILTIPNLLSFLRALGIPLLIWLILVKEFDGWAIFVLTVAGISDYADGKIARAFNQSSKLGAMLDPAVDRLYIAATLIALAIRDVVPLWILLLLIARDLLLATTLPALYKIGHGPMAVTFLGKAATFNLLYAFPFLLLASGDSFLARFADSLAWAFAGWGVALYLLTGFSYFLGARRIIQDSKS
jgi:cardiolipin synthase (CMP-forming)